MVRKQQKFGKKYPIKYPDTSKTQLSILYLIEANPNITREEMAIKLNLSLPGIKKNIRILKDKKAS